MKLTIYLFVAATLLAQSAEPDRLLAALKDRTIADQISRMKTDDRIKAYEAMTAHMKDNLHYQNLLATAYIQKMRETANPDYLTRAGGIVDGVINADGGNYEALRLRSQIELERHNFAAVATVSRTLIKIAPDDPWNWGTLGDALMEIGQYEPAADAYQRMMTLRPDLASYNRASYYRFVMGDVAGAIEVMKKAISSGSRSPENVAWCLVDLGNIYLKTGQLEIAEQGFNAALKVFPQYHAAYYGLGRVHLAQGKHAAAIQELKQAQASVPMVEYVAALEDAYLAAGKPEEAAGQQKMIDTIDRLERANNQAANRTLAVIYADRGRKLDRAMDLAQAELKVRQDIYTYDALAWVLFKNQRLEEAASAAAKALRLGTPEASFYYHAGLIAKAQGLSAEARKHLEKALAVNAQFSPAATALKGWKE
ncbi:MAG: tetratricopeptide repeat protein [Bryobacteraceae bacterium]|nr:tetratricopeptide repeat protein [Bryobacteraceae bacterium]